MSFSIIDKRQAEQNLLKKYPAAIISVREIARVIEVQREAARAFLKRCEENHGLQRYEFRRQQHCHQSATLYRRDDVIECYEKFINSAFKRTYTKPVPSDIGLGAQKIRRLAKTYNKWERKSVKNDFAKSMMKNIEREVIEEFKLLAGRLKKEMDSKNKEQHNEEKNS